MTVRTFSLKIRQLRRLLWSTLALMLVLSLFASSSLPRTAQAERAIEQSTPSTPVTFTNPNSIIIGDDVIGTPYPSTITVSGLNGNVSTVPGSLKVTINRFNHNFPGDVGMVLVGPTGVAFAFQDGAGFNAHILNLTYSVADNGTSRLPRYVRWGTATYLPANYFADDSFPLPGPGTNYLNPGPDFGGTATFASAFGGTNPNGEWKLFVFDFVSGIAGTIAGGWSLTIDTNPPPETHRAMLDFDGDGKTDYVVTRDTGGARTWYLQQSTAGFAAIAWGSAGDANVPGDYDGDGKWDLAVFRAGIFYILQSSDRKAQTISLGSAGDNPYCTQDFDGDGRADPTIIRNLNGLQTWEMQRSVLGYDLIQFGNVATDTPIRGDFDGDGLADVAVYRDGNGTPANTFIRYQSMTHDTYFTTFGNRTSDNIVPGDFDFDRKTDFAVWRGMGAGANGAWYWLNSANGQFNALPFGVGNQDLPVPGDYDGDGKTDQAVWRPTNGTFYINGGASGFSYFPFGATGDSPVGYLLQVR